MAANFDNDHVSGEELAVSELLGKLRTTEELTAADVAALARLDDGPGDYGPDPGGDESGDGGPLDCYPPLGDDGTWEGYPRPGDHRRGTRSATAASLPGAYQPGPEADLEPGPPPEEWLVLPDEPVPPVAEALEAGFTHRYPTPGATGFTA